VNTADSIVFLVDDDVGMREALQDLFAARGMRYLAFGSASEYIACQKPDVPTCLVLDVGLPDISGLELQRQLAHVDHPPIVFITGQGDIPSSVRAIKAGAVDFLTKPFRQQDLLVSIRAALELDRARRAERAELAGLRHRFDCLTPREREVLPLVVGGFLNKQAAARLGISEITLQIHRSKIMQKMQAESLAALVRMAAALKLSPTTPTKRY
jgi:FixJ family two-component response regulator